MRFYGLNYKDFDDMPARLFSSLWQNINRIEAKEAIVAVQVATYPHKKKKDANEFYKKLVKEANGKQ